jgi:hypothetical protein
VVLWTSSGGGFRYDFSTIQSPEAAEASIDQPPKTDQGEFLLRLKVGEEVLEIWVWVLVACRIGHASGIISQHYFYGTVPNCTGIRWRLLCAIWLMKL